MANQPKISDSLKQKIEEEKRSSAGGIDMTRAMDPNIMLMMQQKKQQKVGKLSESQAIEYQQGMEDQKKFHDLLQGHMEVISTRKAYFTAATHVLLSFVTAPLFTIGTSLQFSIGKNAVTLQEFKKTDETSRKFQARMGHLSPKAPAESKSVRFGFLDVLKKGSGSSSANTMKMASVNLPFKAPVYRSYWEALNGIYKQGFRGFYKGNGIRCFHILLFHRMNSDLNNF